MVIICRGEKMFPFILVAAGVLANELNEQNATNKTVLSNNNNGYSTKDVAEILGISEYTVRQKIREKSLKAEKIKGIAGYRISQDNLDNYIKTKKHRSNVQPTNKSINSNSVANIKDFSGTLGNIANTDDKSIYDIGLLTKIKEGKVKDLNGLNLRLQMLSLDKNDSPYFQKKELALKIAINDLEAAIQAYDLLIASFKKNNENKDMLDSKINKNENNT